ncbi:sensor histidine kinase [Larkinella humicola]|uniref:histidine kinase n=1 Tax=Larkinella humicola TaxID=2607654 RepID=A0A5N1JLB6_9BACT|nr:PAS domain-containing sensor histidine kinase [Larkinella humicola]KAA9356911.1 PAS domain-containing protein [Larkinella humicola]
MADSLNDKPKKSLPPEEQPKDQSDLLQGILINIPTGLYVYDPVFGDDGQPTDFRLVLLNPLAAQLVDRPSDALIGESMKLLLPSLITVDLCALAIQVFQTHQTHQFETEFHHRNGLVGWYKISISRYDHRIIVTTIDITALKEVQVRLQKVTETMQTMLDGSPIAISQLKAVRDRKGNLIDFVYEGANEKYALLLKRSVSDLVGKRFLGLFPEARELIFADYAQAIENGEPRRTERYYAGEPLRGWFDIAIIKNDDGVVASYLDINDRKEAERQLAVTMQNLQEAKNQADMDLIRLQIAEEEVNRVLRHEREINTHQSQFITFVSHQFRNPMTGILLAAEALAKFSERSMGTVLAEKVAHYAHQTRQEIQRLDKLLTKVLFQDRMQLLQIALRIEDVELVAFCKNLIAQQLEQHPDYQRIQFQSDQETIWAKGDLVILEQVLENLMSNALKYSIGSEKPVEVGIDTVDHEIRISVRDFGIGIPGEELEHVGKTFFRASNTSFISGIGLGLSLSRQFIKQHGGRLDVESKLNQYTLCTIVLPC